MPEVQILIEEFTSNYEIIKTNVTYGFFSTTLHIINVNMDNPACLLADEFEGSFGDVYKTYANSPIAIKAIKLLEQQF